MAKVVNLRTVRKQRGRAEERKPRGRRRAAGGRGGAERAACRSRGGQRRRLDGHRIDDPE